MQTESRIPTPEEVALLDAVISAVTRSRRMCREDAEDFRQSIHLRIAERGGDLFRQFDGRSSLKTYLTVVVYRLLLDWQNHEYGKWRPSAAAKRLGPVAVTLDRLTDRDGYTVEQAVEYLRAGRPDLDPVELRRLASLIPRRRTRHVVATELSPSAQSVTFDDPVEQTHRARRADRHRLALRRALAAISCDERRLIWLRYRQRLTIRDVAERLQTDPKALYRRFDRILGKLRRLLMKQGVCEPVTIEL
jgi:RNA polymerase sigma factor for flagellar operon FliA